MAEYTLADLKEGATLHVTDTVTEVWMPLYPPEGPPQWIKFENVPIGLLAPPSD